MDLHKYVLNSQVLQIENAEPEAIESAKKAIREALAVDVTDEQLMYIIIDFLAVLKERDEGKFIAVLTACAVHAIEEQLSEKFGMPVHIENPFEVADMIAGDRPEH